MILEANDVLWCDPLGVIVPKESDKASHRVAVALVRRGLSPRGLRFLPPPVQDARQGDGGRLGWGEVASFLAISGRRPKDRKRPDATFGSVRPASPSVRSCVQASMLC